MDARVGDRIVVDTQKVGEHAREGEILKVYEPSDQLHVLVRWDDGHETDIRPAVGSARVIRAKQKAHV